MTKDNDMFEGLFSSLGDLAKTGSVELVRKDSIGVDIDRMILDHIYGLLTLDTLTAEQVTVLTALLGTINVER